MGSKDPRVDAYIARAAPFAQPLLSTLRERVHAACPEVRETIKWGMPFFEHGEHILAHMAAFKQHCGFGFWRGRNVVDLGKTDEAMGQLGRITGPADLPPVREFKALVQAAMARAEGLAAAPPNATKNAAKNTAKKVASRGAPEVPADLAAALAKSPTARLHYQAFAPSKQRDYVEWVTEAKREATRASRIEQAVVWLAEGKARHWKYQG